MGGLVSYVHIYSMTSVAKSGAEVMMRVNNETE